MALFEKMKDSISIAGQEVSQKAKSATENVRIGNLIKANERMIEKLTYQVGVQCVNNHIQDADSEYSELFQEIRRLRAENQAYQEELERVTAVNVCTQCGMGNKPTAKFCIGCGAPLAQPAPEPQPAGGKKCPACGMNNEPDAMFCVECGNRFPEEAQAGRPGGTAEEPDEIQGQPEAAENICKNCGAVLADDMLFCTSCGTKRD